MLRRLQTDQTDFAASWRAICRRDSATEAEVERQVAEILGRVRREGDAAVVELTRRFDGREPVRGHSYELDRAHIEAAAQSVPAEVRSALQTAAEGIRRFHEPQKPSGYALEGQGLALRIDPLLRVGLYVPGGTARYPSSVLMTAIPAQVAGVQEIVMVTPGASPATLLAAQIAGVHRVFEIGGAQAVGALAYGTECVPRVDKIVGPGNQWVAAAKRQVFGQVDIDSIAGPSEVLIVADDSANPRWVAADLLAQAEHDVEARAILVATSAALVDAVEGELGSQLADLPRRDIAGESLSRHGAAVLAESTARAMALASDYASEHLELCLRDAERWAKSARAGAIFVGSFSPEAAGDYSAGPNHVLPTGGAARFASPLGVYDFVKHTSVLSLDRAQLAALRPSIAAIAEVEGLQAHAQSVEVRFEDDRS